MSDIRLASSFEDRGLDLLRSPTTDPHLEHFVDALGGVHLLDWDLLLWEQDRPLGDRPSTLQLSLTVLLTSLIGIWSAPAAKATTANDVSLSFDLAPHPAADSQPPAQPSAPIELPPPEIQPLVIPQQAAVVPLGSADARAVAALPPPPQAMTAPKPEPVAPPPVLPASVSAQPIELSFEPTSIQATQQAPPPSDVPPAEPGLQTVSRAVVEQNSNLDTLFSGGSDSLVARAVGAAEGTRTPNGGQTWAYRGHVDPGNGVWNMGTFSYQHGARTPEEADQRQLNRLKNQAQLLRQQAATQGLELSLEEELNGIDLANQSPQAALSPGGYVDRLKEAHQMGLQGSEAVLWARTYSYVEPKTQRWNAPGLGNTAQSVTRDQERRRQAIARAVEVAPIPTLPSPVPAPPEPPPEAAGDRPPDADAILDEILSLDLAPAP